MRIYYVYDSELSDESFYGDCDVAVVKANEAQAEIERLQAQNRELRAEVASYREMIREGGLDQGTP